MKRSILLSLTAATSLAACRDVAGPEKGSSVSPESAPVPTAGVVADSAASFSVVALEDAADRLVAGLPREDDRVELRAALQALARSLGLGEGARARAQLDRLQQVIARLSESGDETIGPQVGAIALAVDGADRVIVAGEQRAK